VKLSGGGSGSGELMGGGGAAGAGEGGVGDRGKWKKWLGRAGKGAAGGRWGNGRRRVAADRGRRWRSAVAGRAGSMRPEKEDDSSRGGRGVAKCGVVMIRWVPPFFKLHSTTQTLTTRTHTHPYEYTYTNPTPMSTSEGLSTGKSGDSRSHPWRLVVDGNVAYHLTHNTGKSWKI
jgi:hypothetical protein